MGISTFACNTYECVRLECIYECVGLECIYECVRLECIYECLHVFMDGYVHLKYMNIYEYMNI